METTGKVSSRGRHLHETGIHREALLPERTNHPPKFNTAHHLSSQSPHQMNPPAAMHWPPNLQAPISRFLSLQWRSKPKLISLGSFCFKNQLSTTGSQAQASSMPPRPYTIAELRRTSSAIFSTPAFKKLVWAGVHGHSAYGRQDNFAEALDEDNGSDEESVEDDHVDIVAVWNPKAEPDWNPARDEGLIQSLAKLRQAWGRDVEVLDIMRGKLGDDIQMGAMLGSRAIYGSEKDEIVMKLRKEARAVVDEGIVIYTHISNEIEDVRQWSSNVEWEDFITEEHIRRTLETRVNSILEDLRYVQENSLLKTAHLYTILVPAEELRGDLLAKSQETNSKSDPQSAYWKALWTAAIDTTFQANNLSNFGKWIKYYVIDHLRRIVQASDELLQLDEVESLEGAVGSMSKLSLK